MYHFKTIPTVSAAGKRIPVFFNGGDEVAQHEALQEQAYGCPIAWIALLVEVFGWQMHGFPRLGRRLVLSFVDEHRRAHALPHGDASFGADDVNAVAVVVGLGLGEELHIRVDAVGKAERGVPALAEHNPRIAVFRVYLLGVFDVIDG